MVRIRLRRVGSRGQPSYRIVAADKESPRDGKFLEILGHYNPRTEPSTVVVDEERLFHWMRHGAQPSDAVVSALRSGGTWERWERYKGGESLDTLLAEMEAGKIEVDPRTRRDDLQGKSKKKAEAEESVEEVKEVEPASEAEPEDAAEGPPDVDAAEETKDEPPAAEEAEAEAEPEDAAEGPPDVDAAEETKDEPPAAEEAEAEPAEEGKREEAEEAPVESEDAEPEPEETEPGEDAEAASDVDAVNEDKQDAEAEPDEDAKE